jgi:hypothetical protein
MPEFHKNVEAVSQVLTQVLAGAHVTVLGITDDSFAQPYFLLRASVASEVGHFGEKLASARQRLETSWKARSRDLAPSFAGTDLFGHFSWRARSSKKADRADTMFWSYSRTCGRNVGIQFW